MSQKSKSAPRQARPKPKVLVGYQLFITFKDWTFHHQYLWCEKPPDAEWDAVIADETVLYARLERRHKKFKSFSRLGEQAGSTLPAKSHEGFSLLK